MVKETAIAKIRNILTPYKNYFTFLQHEETNPELVKRIEEEKNKCIELFPKLEELLVQAERDAEFIHKAAIIRSRIYYTKRYKIIDEMRLLSKSLKDIKEKSSNTFQSFDDLKSQNKSIKEYRDTILDFQRQKRTLLYKLKLASRKLNKLDERFKKTKNYYL